MNILALINYSRIGLKFTSKDIANSHFKSVLNKTSQKSFFLIFKFDSSDRFISMCRLSLALYIRQRLKSDRNYFAFIEHAMIFFLNSSPMLKDLNISNFVFSFISEEKLKCVTAPCFFII